MKELILIRHAKSDWANEFIMDIDRPLAERGYADAYRLGKWLSSELKKMDYVISSPATRALNTAFIFCRAFGMNESEIVIDKELYESSSEKYLKSISKIPNTVMNVMVFGHNPVLTSLANTLTSDLFFDNIPTCGIVRIGYSGSSWKDISNKLEGKLIEYKFPKNFRQ